MDFITKLRNEFSTLQGEYKTLLDTVEKREDNKYSDEEKGAQDKRFARMEAIKAQIEERSKFAKLALEEGTVTKPADPEGREEFAESRNVDIRVGDVKIDKAEFSRAINKWVLTGQMDRKYATITSATQSAILLPSSVAAPVNTLFPNAFRQAHQATGVPVIETADTGVLKLPLLSSSAGGAVTETASSETENASALTRSIVLTPATYQSGTQWVSGLSLASNSFDVFSYLQTQGEFSKETGLMYAIADALIADSAITQNTNVTSGAPTYAEMATWNRSLVQEFDQLKVMVLDGTVISYLEGITTTAGAPIFITDAQTGQLRSAFGTPVVRCDRFANKAASDTSVMGVLISMLGFKLRDAGPRRIQRFDQNQARPDQYGINVLGYHAYGYSVDAVSKLLA